MLRNSSLGAQSGIFRRIAAILRLPFGDKQALSVCADRMAALNDPSTRRALAGLPQHLLRDIGVKDARIDEAPVNSPEGEALRRHLW